jgi:D-tyrosyl-tRNA(Tyr) deacylase
VRAVAQRVSSAKVVVAGEVIGRIDEPGLMVLVGVTHTDTEQQAAKLAAKVWQLRIMPDEQSCADLNAPLLVVSQFTLYADTRKGRRPSWSKAAPGPVSEPLVERFIEELRRLGATVQTGRFGADMEVSLVNQGPMTLIVDVDE